MLSWTSSGLGELRGAAGAPAAALAAGQTAEHPPRPEVSPRRGRGGDCQPRRTRVVGSAERRQGRRVRPRTASRSQPEFRSGPAGAAALRRTVTDLPRGSAHQPAGAGRPAGRGALEHPAAPAPRLASMGLSNRRTPPDRSRAARGGRRRRGARGVSRQRLVRASRRWTRLSRRGAWAGVQGIAAWRPQDAVPASG